MNKINIAVKTLEDNITSINTVSEWCSLLGYSSVKYFSILIRNKYGVRPKELIIEKKIQKIFEHISTFPDKIFYASAKELGFKDDQALYKFVKRHTGKTLTHIKCECQK